MLLFQRVLISLTELFDEFSDRDDLQRHFHCDHANSDSKQLSAGCSAMSGSPKTHDASGLAPKTSSKI